MRLTRSHFATLKEDPRGAESASHKLMLRAGLILANAAGIYTYSPLLWRTLKKIAAIVSDEMDRAGAQEMMMPMLQPEELWARSKRLDAYLASGLLWRVRDRRGGWYALGPTHEEIATEFVDRTVSSYRQLPLTLYHQGAKFRDELRPQHGVIRAREFLMKDAYSFDADEEGLARSYAAMREAYGRILERCGLDYIVVRADVEDIGGTDSEEFVVAAEGGMDLSLKCSAGCGYAASASVAESAVQPPAPAEPRPLRREATPGVTSVDQLRAFFPDLDARDMVKTLVYSVAYEGSTRREIAVALIRADRDVNETKLRQALGALAVELADDAAVREATGAEVGFAGPLGFVNHQRTGYDVRVIADETVRGMRNFLCGLNETDHHALDVNMGRDLPEPEYRDIRFAAPGEPCPRCGAALEEVRGIEVGHLFRLGTRYSAAMGATYLDQDGAARPFVMGCYGLGTSRLAAAAIERRHDERGIVWPESIAPHLVHLVGLNMEDATIAEVAERTYEALLAAGVEVLYDDRPELRAGVKFADADLLGLPWRVNVGRGAADGRVEIVARATRAVTEVGADEVVAWLAERAGRR